MKSRFLLHTKSPDLTAPARAQVSPARRFDLQRNASPRLTQRRQQRREGQALLLAVLIMLLAALLSAGVLGVVSGNLNQTARIADKTKAIEASRAGIAYANAQLSGSASGDLWRPVDVSPVPATNDAAYNSYYSQLDKVQGWALDPATTPRDQLYAKFPAPNQPIGDAPKFLVQVKQIPLMLSAGDPEMGHEGEIKITSIGLSDDDPNVFNTAIAYKDGRRKSPWASALRSVSNWNFGTNNQPTGVPYAQVSAAAAAGATANSPATNVDVSVQTRIDNKDAPQFSPTDVPFNVVIINKSATTPTVRGAVVTAVTPVSNVTTTLRLARLDSPLAVGETIQKAAALGTGSTIDLLNTGTPATLASLYPSGKDELYQRNGILANGSIWLQGQISLSDLNKFGTKIVSSGSIALDAASKPVVAPTTLPSPNYGIAGSGTLVSSNSTNFPGTFTTDSGAKVTPLDVINDGWNKIGAQTLGLDYSNSRDVEPFTPAKIDSTENLARYRALTRNSVNGVYIDNRSDTEKVGTAEMTQRQLLEMLTSPTQTMPTDYTRTGTAVSAGTVGSSLEQKHLRGWIGSDEFLARGTLVEISPLPDLNGNTPSLRVTLDARGDSTTALPNNDSGPVADKAFRKADGTPDTGVYTKILPWPANGTLFAEGNLRIRGDVGTVAAPRSLTVVSMNNIYIEGSVSVDNSLVGTAPNPDRKKLMLMAKKNVIVNPTRAVLARTDAQTVANNTAAITLTGVPGTATTPATAATFVIPVADAGVFNTGDYAEITGTTLTTPIRGLVTAIATNQLTISSTAVGVIPPSTLIAPVIVRSPLEKRQAVTVGTNQEFFSLVDTENALNRRLVAPILRQNATINKLLFDHIGELKQTGGVNDGLKVKAEDASAATPRPSGFTAELTNKQTLVTGTQNNDPTEKSITDPNKKLRLYNNFATAPNTDEFSASATKNLTQFAAEISAVVPRTDGGMPPEGYKYTSTLTSAAVGALPSFALAGIGLRYAPGAYYDYSLPPADPAHNRRQDINTNEFTVPLATSIEFDLNSTLAELGVVGEARTVKYLGFNPVFGTSDDALTIDSNFYQLPTDILKSTLDSRVVTLGANAGTTTRVNFPQSIVLKRTTKFSDKAPGASDFLPAYKVRALKMENYNSNNNGNDIQPAGDTMQINAFVYAQEGSWLVIPSDYFRTNPPIRGIMNAAGTLIGSYIDYNNNKVPDAPAVGQPTEYIIGDPTNANSPKVADLNRNGKDDTGELEAALQFVRYNTVQIEFYGAIVENQTAVVADVADPTAGNPPLVKGAVQDWMDKWASYNDVGVAPADVGKPNLFKFINYAYDPTLANGNTGANQLRIPLTDDLIYQQ